MGLVAQFPAPLKSQKTAPFPAPLKGRKIAPFLAPLRGKSWGAAPLLRGAGNCAVSYGVPAPSEF